MLLPITTASAAAAALVTFWHAVRIIQLRAKSAIVHGDGGDALMVRRMRAHSNFTEYTPMTLILCGLVELAQGGAIWLEILMAAFILGRVAHVIGMDSEKSNPLRSIGMTTTFITLLVLTVAALLTLYNSAHLA